MRPFFVLAAVAASLTGFSTAAPAASAKQNLYVSNANGAVSKTVMGFDINDSTGALSAIGGSPFPVPVTPAGIAIDPLGKHAYIGAGAVHRYDVDAATGALTYVGATASGSSAVGLAFDPAGKHLFVPNLSSHNVSVFNIDPASGNLTHVPGSPFAAGNGPLNLVTDPSGKFLFVSDRLANKVMVFTIDQVTGALAEISGSPFAAGSGPSGVAIDPSGKYLYVTNFLSTTTNAYKISASTGTLTPVAGSPFAGGSNPFGVVIDPGGSHLYTANKGSNNVSAFDIDAATGALTPVAGSPFAAGSGTIGLAMDYLGKWVYASNYDGSGSISGFSVNSSTGVLAPTAGSPYATGLVGSQPSYASITPHQGPHATFTVAAAPPGSPTSFDASGSSSENPSRTKYNWDFGDGSVLLDGGPTPKHVYASDGSYSVTLSLTGDDACDADSSVWAGYTAFCDGSQARRTATVTLPGTQAAPSRSLVLSGLSLSPRNFKTVRTGPQVRASKKSAKKAKGGTTIRFKLSEAAKVSFTLQAKQAGRRKGKRCAAGKKAGAAKRAKRCTRTVKAGSFTAAGRAGSNRLWYSGRVGKRALEPGGYQLIAVARSGVLSSATSGSKMTIKKPRRAKRH